MYVDNLLDRSDELMHYGTPRHSGRYPWGSGERPFQGDGLTPMAQRRAARKAARDAKETKRYEMELSDPDRSFSVDDFTAKRQIITAGYLTKEQKAKVIKQLKEERAAIKKDYENQPLDQASKLQDIDSYIETAKNMKVIDADEYASVYKQLRKKQRRAEAIGGLATATAIGALGLLMSDDDKNNYVAMLADKADDLEHGGPGSGRYEWGSGERPYQHRLPPGYMRFALPAHTGSYHQGHQSSRSSSSSSSKSSGPSSSSSSNTGASSQYDAYKAEEAKYKRNEERRKQQKHAADMADRARKIRKEDAKEKADKEKADKKEREDLEDAYWKEVTNMTSQLASIRTHAKNLKAASKPVKDVTKKMSDQQLKELTDRLKLENSYLRELNTKQGYMAQPDKLDNFIGLMGDITSMGRSASKVYRTANKQRKYL